MQGYTNQDFAASAHTPLPHLHRREGDDVDDEEHGHRVPVTAEHALRHRAQRRVTLALFDTRVHTRYDGRQKMYRHTTKTQRQVRKQHRLQGPRSKLPLSDYVQGNYLRGDDAASSGGRLVFSLCLAQVCDKCHPKHLVGDDVFLSFILFQSTRAPVVELIMSWPLRQIGARSSSPWLWDIGIRTFLYVPV